MRILAIDVGTGTQDILLFDSTQPIENALQLIMPSPTQIAAGRIRRATEARHAVYLMGVIAGGGPCHWALEDHLRAGLAAFATPDAARTFDDDLENVQRLGVTLVSEDEAIPSDAERVELRDLDLDAVRQAFAAFDVDTSFDGLALGCLDHGAAPPGYSDRLFRFDHLRRVVEGRNDLLGFAFVPEELPEYLTRARTLVACAEGEAPIVFLDTGPAAALGALQDPGEVTKEQIEDFTERLISGKLPHEDVFGSKGHGVFYAADGNAGGAPFVAVTGPQRGKLRDSRLRPYFASPHGDMMVAGCFGLVWAFAEKYPERREEITAALGVEKTDVTARL